MRIDWQFVVLLVAIGITWLAWRRARRQAQLERARAATLEEPRWQYRLAGTAAGGWIVETLDGKPVRDEALDWDRDGLEVIRVAPDAAHGPADASRAGPDADSTAAGAGSGVRLMPQERDGEHVVEAWDEDGGRRLGSLHGARARSVAERLESGDLTDCVVLGAAPAAGTGSGWRLLLVHRDADVEA